MGRRVKLPKTAIDDVISTKWAISFLSSVGAGKKKGGSLALFDLYNRETYRAHVMTVIAAGKSSGLPAELSFVDSGYVKFETTKPANFDDFHLKVAQIEIKDRAVKSWRELTVYDKKGNRLMKVNVNNWNPNIPHKFSGKGITEVYYSDGKPVGNPEYEVRVDVPTDEDLPTEFRVTEHDFGLVIRAPGDLLFLFDEPKESQMADWKFDYEASDKLSRLMRYMNKTPTPYKRLKVEGHTDSREKTPGHNMALSKRRAQAVIDYFKKYKWGLDHELVIDAPVGFGASRPVAPNEIGGKDNPPGREQNRRVELYLYKN
jgi:outer membrane protein OmpA-like peptidoglycan-associated protein